MATRPADARLPHSGSFGAERFIALWQRCIDSPPSPQPHAVFARLADELSAPGRHYHNLGHIRDCLQRLDAVRTLIAQPDAVELGLWFHDVLLTPGAIDNERRSAVLFVSLAAGARNGLRATVARMILATRHHRRQHGDRGFIVDIDLAGLAAPWDEFMHTGDLLREEFAQQGDAAYYRGQVGFLKSLLARRTLFATPHFRDRCEAAARANLQRLLALRAAQGHGP
ncbi:MAG: hypothetical protein ABI920_09955 [Casimicrobiaceae bacterium]